MQGVLDPLKRRLLPQCELFSSGVWNLRFDCCCHVDVLAVGGNSGFREEGPSPLLVGWLHLARWSQRRDYFLNYLPPQQTFSASADVMLSTPSTGLSVTSAIPASTNSSPGEFCGFSAPLLSTICLSASMPFCAIFTGYCWEVAPMVPSLTIAMPGLQPPSTETTSASLMPAACSASTAPAAVGSLIV